MKNQLAIAVLAVLAFYASAAVLNHDVLSPVQVVDKAAAVQAGPVAQRNVSVGGISNRDRLLYRNYYSKPRIANAIQTQDIIYRGNSTNRISAVRANEYGNTQYANARIVSGGVGYNNVTIRLTSARGYGYYFLIEIWGR